MQVSIFLLFYLISVRVVNLTETFDLCISSGGNYTFGHDFSRKLLEKIPPAAIKISGDVPRREKKALKKRPRHGKDTETPPTKKELKGRQKQRRAAKEQQHTSAAAHRREPTRVRASGAGRASTNPIAEGGGKGNGALSRFL